MQHGSAPPWCFVLFTVEQMSRKNLNEGQVSKVVFLAVFQDTCNEGHSQGLSRALEATAAEMEPVPRVAGTEGPRAGGRAAPAVSAGSPLVAGDQPGCPSELRNRE